MTAEVFQRFKERRKVTKASVTRRINDIEKLLCVIDNFDEVIAAEKVFDEAMERFYRAHEDYHQVLQTVEERQMSIIYLRDQVKLYQDFKERINRYLEISRRVLTPTERGGEHLSDTVSRLDPRVGEELQVVGSQVEDHIQPHDSVGQIELRPNAKQQPRVLQSRSGSGTASVSRASQRSARSISVAGERIRLAAEKAAMIVEASLLSEKDSLAQERLRLEQKERLLKLKTEIAKTEAKEKIYEDFEVIDDEYSSRIRPSSGQSGVKIEPSFLISTPRVSRDERPSPSQPRNEALFTDPRPRQGVPQSPEAKPLRPYVSTQFPDFRVFQLPKTEIVTLDGNPLNYHLFMKTIENSVEKYTEDGDIRLQLLIQHCTGKGREAIKSCGMLNGMQGYEKAKELLKERFGEKYVVSKPWIDKLSYGPPIRLNDSETLNDLADDLENCEITLKVSGRLDQVNSEDRMVQILQRMPPYLRSRWQKTVQEIRVCGRDHTFTDLKKLIRTAAKEKNDPVFGSILDPVFKQDRSKVKPRTRFSSTHAVHAAPTDLAYSPRYRVGNGRGFVPVRSSVGLTLKPSIKCFLCNGGHKLETCGQFKAKSREEKLKFVRDRKLCENCLSYSHFASGCKSPRSCTIGQCTIAHKHLQSLHDALVASFRSRDGEGNNERFSGPSVDQRPAELHAQQSHHVMKRSVEAFHTKPEIKALPIVPVKVKVRGKDVIVTTYAMLDSGSTSSWCSESLAKRLGVVGSRVLVSLSTIETDSTPLSCRRVNLEIMDIAEVNIVELPDVLTKDKLNVSSDCVSSQDDVDPWPHLSDIKVPKVIRSEVELLIGQDVPEALEPSEIRSCRGNGPYATKTKFGWTLNGPLGRHSCFEKRYVNFIRTDEEMGRMFQQFMNLEFSESVSDLTHVLSRQDEKVISIYEESARLVDSHYEIAIPWKLHPPGLPNNRPLAEHRLKLLRKRLVKDPELYSTYSAFISDLLDKGYAKRVPEDRRNRDDGKVWYLPHHSVVHPKKPEKVRVVFDCAARYRGTSLNDRVLRGPDLTKKLVGVLLRFREEPFALMADIEAMYHQIKVHPDDVDALRFLWYPDSDLSRDPVEFHMSVHLFGGVWSASCANFGLLRTARDNSSEFHPSVSSTVTRNFYVDDCLTSVKSQDEAIDLVNELQRLLRRGGFNLTKWICNSRAVLEKIPQSDRAKEVKDLDLSHDVLPVERVLGVHWNVERDEFVFKIQVKDKPLTRRGLLSIVSSIYDPLGFTAPLVLSAKIVLQDLCRRKMNWDDAIPSDCLPSVQRWLEELPALGQFSVGRCYKPEKF